MSGQSPQPYPADWYPDPYGPPNTLRWFDGWQWSSHTMPAPPQPAVRVQPTVVVAGGGGAASTAVSVQGPNHLLHLILTVCTCGFWLPVWIIIAIFGRRTVTAAATSAAAPTVLVHQPVAQPQTSAPQVSPAWNSLLGTTGQVSTGRPLPTTGAIDATATEVPNAARSLYE